MQRISTTIRVIAIDTPNTNTVNGEWGTYRTWADLIELVTGNSMLSALPVALQRALERRIDAGWPHLLSPAWYPGAPFCVESN